MCTCSWGGVGSHANKNTEPNMETTEGCHVKHPIINMAPPGEEERGCQVGRRRTLEASVESVDEGGGAD